jgi:septal ring factor EnvC (AmiA/AmiB activator)
MSEDTKYHEQDEPPNIRGFSAFDLDRLEAELAAVTEQRDEARSEIEKLKEELESHAWTISPAMAQAKIDELIQQRDRLAEAMRAMWPFIEEDPPCGGKSEIQQYLQALAAVEGGQP